MSEEDLANGIIFPPLSSIRNISKEVGSNQLSLSSPFTTPSL